MILKPNTPENLATIKLWAKLVPVYWWSYGFRRWMKDETFDPKAYNMMWYTTDPSHDPPPTYE